MNGTKVTENEVKLWQQKADEGLSARKIGNLFGRQHSTVLSYVDIPKENSVLHQAHRGTH